MTKTKLSTGDSPLDLQAHHSSVFIAHRRVFKLLVSHKITQKVKSGAITLISQFKTKTKLPFPISDPEIKEDRAVSPLSLGLPEGRTVSPFRLGLPEAGLCLPSDWGSLRAGLCLPSAWGSLRAGLCLPSDWGSLRQGCVSPQTGAP